MSDAGRLPVADPVAISPCEIVVSRTARYYTLGPRRGSPREIWIVCHGYGQLAEHFLRQFAPLDDGARIIIAPEGLSRFYLDPIPMRRHDPTPRIGASWMTRESRESEIHDYVCFIESVFSEVCRPLASSAPRVVVLGFSQGTATVSRWLASTSCRVDQIVLWGGTLPPELDLADWGTRVNGAGVTFVIGEDDRLVPPAAIAAEAGRLLAAGIPCTLERYAGGHAIDGQTLQRLASGFDAR